MTLTDFAIACLLYAARTNASATSWFRSSARNLRVDGVPHSAHLAGLGVDVVYDTPLELNERMQWANRFGLRLIPEGDHDHLQPLSWLAG